MIDWSGRAEMKVRATLDKRSAVLEELRKRIEEAQSKEVRVGIVKTASYANKQSYYGGPLMVAEVALYYEYGWVQRVTGKQAAYLNSVLVTDPNDEKPIRPGMTLYQPPRPFLRGTFAEKHKDWAEYFGEEFASTLDGVRALEKVGFMAAQDIRHSLSSASANGEEFARRSDLTLDIYEARAEGHKMNGTQNTTTDPKPGILTGRLLSSIDYEVVDKAG